MMRRDAELAGAVRAHRALVDSLDGLTDAEARRASALPGWSVGHLLTHLARNADGFTGIIEAAGSGEVADMYAGGTEGRTAAIETGAGRPADELVQDVADSARRLEAAWDVLGPGAWEGGEGRTLSGPLPLREVGFMRWREVVVHHADLGLGYGLDDWPDDYVKAELARSIVGLADRLPKDQVLELVATDTGETWMLNSGPGRTVVLEASRRKLLAWMLGRLQKPAWPMLIPWRPVRPR